MASIAASRDEIRDEIGKPMDLREEVRKLLQEIGPGRINSTAYDMAWVARLGEIGEPIGRYALDWLRDNQLSDGSWGAEDLCYYHDRVISTLAAMNALARQSRSQDRERLQSAEIALHQAISGLETDLAGHTVGFELIIPTLLYEAKALGVLQNQEKDVLRKLTPQRAAKLSILPKGIINRTISTAFSAEMAGSDGMSLLDIDNLQEPNGSIGYSPSATAYFSLYVDRRNQAALKYLTSLSSQNIIPSMAPFNVFEPAWVLYNLALTNCLNDELLSLCKPHLDFLERSWLPGKGVGFAAEYIPKDSDETSLVYDVLMQFNRKVDIKAILYYEQPYYFRCYDLESTPSVSANIHVLGALRRAGYHKDSQQVKKITQFLDSVQEKSSCWFDKWHISPYYATAQAVIASTGYVDEIVEDAIIWFLNTQNEDGSWGYYLPTAEETAYSLQALSIWNQYNKGIPKDTLKHGQNWLMQHSKPPYPSLWIAKSLYCPELIVRSKILSALLLVEEELI